MILFNHLRLISHSPCLWGFAFFLGLNPFSHAQTYRLVWEDEFNQFDPTTPSSSASLTSEAWQALEKKDYATAKARIEKCRQLYEAKAVEMQAGLTSLPAPDKAHSYWALNDVGTCIFILGKVAEAEGKPKEALRHYQEVVDRFSWSQCWDKQGWFWQPAVAAKERLAALTLETAE